MAGLLIAIAAVAAAGGDSPQATTGTPTRQADEATAAAGSIDLDLARQAFAEAEQACHSPEGGLWRFSLCVPMLLADPVSRDVVASQPDREGAWTERDGVWVGTLPAEVGIANTATELYGVRWTMVMWPLPEERPARVELMMHEAFHNVQATFGFPAVSPHNSHLATRDGRLWLQLEWHALRRALSSTGSVREAAILDALTFRARRRAIFPQAAEQERALEMHEGLAAFTGLHLCGLDRDAQRRILRDRLDEAKASPSLVRSFAYWSGPAYGLLLEEIKAGWRKRLTPAHDLGWMIQHRLGMQLPDDIGAAAAEAMQRYDGERVLAAEQERERAWQERIARFERQLVDGPVVVIPLEAMSVQFDPNSLVPLGAAGTVYPTLRVSDRWGILTVDDAALLASDWSSVRVGAPEAEALLPLRTAFDTTRKLTADGWSLELAPGWKVVAGERDGDWRVEATR